MSANMKKAIQITQTCKHGAVCYETGNRHTVGRSVDAVTAAELVRNGWAVAVDAAPEAPAEGSGPKQNVVLNIHNSTIGHKTTRL